GGPFHSAPVERSTLIQLGFAYALLDRLEVGGYMPLYMQSGQADGTGPSSGLQGKAASGTARGNLRLHAKARLWRRAGFALGASALAAFPTASAGQFTGSGNTEGRLLALGSFTPRALAARLTISANAGAILRGTAEYADIIQKSGIAWGAGGSYRILDSLWAT